MGVAPLSPAQPHLALSDSTAQSSFVIQYDYRKPILP